MNRDGTPNRADDLIGGKRDMDEVCCSTLRTDGAHHWGCPRYWADIDPDALEQLQRRFREAGATGLDLSPGDPLAREASEAMRRLIARIRELERISDEYFRMMGEEVGKANRAIAAAKELRAYIARRNGNACDDEATNLLAATAWLDET